MKGSKIWFGSSLVPEVRIQLRRALKALKSQRLLPKKGVVAGELVVEFRQLFHGGRSVEEELDGASDHVQFALDPGAGQKVVGHVGLKLAEIVGTNPRIIPAFFVSIERQSATRGSD